MALTCKTLVSFKVILNGKKHSVCGTLLHLEIFSLYKLTMCTKYIKLRREPYLNIADSCIGKYIAAHHLSFHGLHIETAHHKGVLRVKGLRKFCNHAVYDEKHSFMKCYHPILSRIRSQFISCIFQINPVLQYL